jgi:hypothetical protein
MPKITYDTLGQASVQQDSFSQGEIIAGDVPAIGSDYGLLQAAQVAGGIPAYTPVRVDPLTRALTLASATPGSLVQANALTSCAIEAGTVAGSSVPVWTSGCFNVLEVAFPASYNTDGLKFSCYTLSPDSNITLKKPYNA